MDPHIQALLQERILTTAELSALTGVPEPTLKKRVERGTVACVKKGRTYLFDRRDFEEAGGEAPGQQTLPSRWGEAAGCPAPIPILDTPPTKGMRRYLVADCPALTRGDGFWVEAPDRAAAQAKVAACFGQEWGRFTHVEWTDPKTGRRRIAPIVEAEEPS